MILRESIQKRIREIDSFFDSNFDKPYIFNFEKGRLKLKKLLMFEPESVTEINKDESINKCVLLGYEKIPEEQEYEFNIIDNNSNNPSSINDEKTIEEKIRDYKNKIVNTMEDINENDEIIENKKNNNKIRNRNKNIESFTPNFNYNDDNYSNKMDYIKTFSNETTTCPNNNIVTEMSEYK